MKLSSESLISASLTNFFPPSLLSLCFPLGKNKKTETGQRCRIRTGLQRKICIWVFDLMGKYMKKSKAVRGDIAVVEGVRTRAKTLALKRLNIDGVVDESSLYYLQLRSRRLEKSTPKQQQRDRDQTCCGAGDNQEKGSESLKEVENATSNEVGLEASLGDNVLDFEPRDRSTRESTPCSLIRGCDTIGTPGSTTRRTYSTATNQGVESDLQRTMPTAHEIEKFFACMEEQQQRLFIEKYNFDIVNDLPLPGRYGWVQVVP